LVLITMIFELAFWFDAAGVHAPAAAAAVKHKTTLKIDVALIKCLL
jgi:hypothetical protein